mmetsp:Transcript_12905/g.27963  ORF Transcript_12905/g.27963 Transcript_12905/m.27963 type:complete len:263 (-) Transcript_12905:295-1083(-)
MTASPYWGNPDATTQFCEAKYVVTPYVAEFWNSTSSAIYVVFAVLGLIRGARCQDLRVKVCWICLGTIGFGSMMFHGTMRFSSQMWDEIPMILLVLSGIACKDYCCWVTSGVGRWIVNCGCWGATLAAVYLYVSSMFYEVFIHTFTALVVIDFLLGITLALSRPKSPLPWLCLLYGVLIGLGRVVWECERLFCPDGGGTAISWLHVVWHFCSAMSAYLGILSNAQARFELLSVGDPVVSTLEAWPFVPQWLNTMGDKLDKRQ